MLPQNELAAIGFSLTLISTHGYYPPLGVSVTASSQPWAPSRSACVHASFYIDRSSQCVRSSLFIGPHVCRARCRHWNRHAGRLCYCLPIGPECNIGDTNNDKIAGPYATRWIRLAPNPGSRGAGDGMKKPSPTCSKANCFSGALC